MFQIFTDHEVKEEVRQMLLQLAKADYAVSDLPYEDIQKYAESFSITVRLRRLKSGKIKVQL